jgi:hypothetical protein
MTWTTPSFEEIKMDAEARSYGNWVDADVAAACDADAAPEAAGEEPKRD